jgi:hypothetical protein
MHPFRTAIEARDMAPAMDCLADDVVLHSPVTFPPFEGRARVEVVLHLVSVRPLSAVAALAEAMGPKVLAAGIK